ncbi:MAG: hypothetical protein AAFX99_23785, partial [Myxococcota bacterium]
REMRNPGPEGVGLGQKLAALAEAHSAEFAYDRLLQLPKQATATHQAYWALRAHLEHRLGRDPCASASWAMKLSDDHAVQAFLEERFGVERGVNPESY